MPPPDDERSSPDASPTVPFADSPAPPPSIAPGQLLAGRFRVRRFIAQGGMGEVWEAEDLELPGERVAVKTIRPEIARDAWAMGRFRREIQLGRKVTHPNVCRIFDVFHHRPAEGSGRDSGAAVTFLTMELLEGETLAHRLETRGRLASAEAQPLVEQMAAALEAAHAAGIVHGDFKSNNVILLEGGPPRGGTAVAGARTDRVPRAVVTDFGLARRGEADRGHATSIVGGEQLVGTPAYMAPELMRGERTSAAADVYALGVVLYEMVTGNLPFEGKTPFAAAVRRLTEAPTPPRRLVPDLDPRWEEAILRCLAPDPAERFQSAADVPRFLAGEAVGGGRRRPARRALVATGAALLLAGALVSTVWLARRSTSGPAAEPATAPAPAGPARRAIAVLGFKNSTGQQEAAWLATGLGEMLATELAAGSRLRVVPAENVARMKLELELGEFDSLAEDTLVRVRRHLGADLVVLGSYYALPGPERRIRVDARLQGAAEGSPSVSGSGTEAELFELVARLGADLRRELGVEPASAAESEEARAAFPAEPEAARTYSEGLARLRLFDAIAARDLFTRAATLAPRQPLPHAGLAAAWGELGYDERAREEAKLAHELASGLPREQRLAVEGRFREATRDWPRAAEVYRTLFEFFPDNLEYGLRLAEVQMSAGDAGQAQATLQALRRLPAPAGEDPRIDLAQAQAAAALSDYAGQRDAAIAAQRKSEALGARLVAARARFSAGAAWRSLGDLAEASRAIEEARHAFLAAGDRSSAARAVNTLGIVAWQRGDLDGARKRYGEALGTFRAIGDQRGVAQSLNNIAILLQQEKNVRAAKQTFGEVLAIYRETGSRQGLAGTLSNLGMVQESEGDLDAGLATYRQALAIQREIGDRQREAVSLNNIARNLRRQGDYAGADSHYRDALAIFRDVGDKSSEGDVLNNLGSIAWRRGEAPEAEDLWRQALARKREVGAQPGVALVLASLGDVLLARGELQEAREAHEEALALRKKLGEPRREAESRAALAAVAAAEGNFEEASALARAAAEQARGAGARDTEAEAEAALAVCLSRTDPAEATSALVRARLAAGQDADPELALVLAITRARLSFAPDEETRRELAAASAAAPSAPAVLLLEARILEAALEPRAPRDRLRALATEASEGGFVRLADEAGKYLAAAGAEL
jgi:tetratricopeptide (TPR) repeat protein/TolB-like protein